MNLLPNIYACLALIFLAIAIMGGGSEAHGLSPDEEIPQELRASRSVMGEEPDAPEAMHLRNRRAAQQQIYKADDVPEQIRTRRQMPDMPPPPQMPQGMPGMPGRK